MTRIPTVVRRLAAGLSAAAGSVAVPVAVSVAVSVALAVLTAGPAQAADSPVPRVHHMFPDDGAVLRDAPDHVEIMFDVLLVPGAVQVGVVPAGTDRLVALPGPPVLDGPLLVQPLPPLPAGRYTVGVRLRGPDGRVSGGTFGFEVNPAAPGATDVPTGTPGAGTVAGRWLAPVVGAVLLLPAVALVRRTRVRRRRPAPARAPAGPARAAGRTPTSASSPVVPPGR